MIATRAGAPPDRGDDPPDLGSIILPVIVVLLVIASAATAMTLKANTSLREAATRRDRLALALIADSLVRSAAVALRHAADSKATPPFPLDGTPQFCRMRSRQLLVLAVQDHGGLIDLNKAPGELLVRAFTRAALPGPEATTLSRAILAMRDADAAPAPRPQPAAAGRAAANPQPIPSRAGFASADELDLLPGITPDLYGRLRPLFTVRNGTAGIDPLKAAPAIRTIMPRQELTSAAFEPFTVSSASGVFGIRVAVVRPSGMRFTRDADFDLGQSRGRFLSWDAPVDTALSDPGTASAFCDRFAAAYERE